MVTGFLVIKVLKIYSEKEINILHFTNSKKRKYPYRSQINVEFALFFIN